MPIEPIRCKFDIPSNMSPVDLFAEKWAVPEFAPPAADRLVWLLQLCGGLFQIDRHPPVAAHAVIAVHQEKYGGFVLQVVNGIAGSNTGRYGRVPYSHYASTAIWSAMISTICWSSSAVNFRNSARAAASGSAGIW